GKNQRSGLSSNTARTRPLPYSPPASAISEMRSNINIGGSGNWALPAPNNSPRPHANRSSYPKLVGRCSICTCPWPSDRVPQSSSPSLGSPNIGAAGGKASGPLPNAGRLELPQCCCEGVASSLPYVTNATIVAVLEYQKV